MLGVPVFSGYQSVGQTVNSGGGAYAAITIDTEVLDPAGGHSNTVNPSRYTPQAPGTYYVVGTVAWAAVSNAASYRRAFIRLNGTAVRGGAASVDQTSNVVSSVTASALVTCNGTTDYIELWGGQSTAGALQTAATTDLTSSLYVFWVSS
jgi:hypothetical protein